MGAGQLVRSCGRLTRGRYPSEYLGCNLIRLANMAVAVISAVLLDIYKSSADVIHHCITMFSVHFA